MAPQKSKVRFRSATYHIFAHKSAGENLSFEDEFQKLWTDSLLRQAKSKEPSKDDLKFLKKVLRDKFSFSPGDSICYKDIVHVFEPYGEWFKLFRQRDVISSIQTTFKGIVTKPSMKESIVFVNLLAENDSRDLGQVVDTYTVDLQYQETRIADDATKRTNDTGKCEPNRTEDGSTSDRKQTSNNRTEEATADVGFSNDLYTISEGDEQTDETDANQKSMEKSCQIISTKERNDTKKTDELNPVAQVSDTKAKEEEKGVLYSIEFNSMNDGFSNLTIEREQIKDSHEQGKVARDICKVSHSKLKLQDNKENLIDGIRTATDTDEVGNDDDEIKDNVCKVSLLNDKENQSGLNQAKEKDNLAFLFSSMCILQDDASATRQHESRKSNVMKPDNDEIELHVGNADTTKLRVISGNSNIQNNIHYHDADVAKDIEYNTSNLTNEVKETSNENPYKSETDVTTISGRPATREGIDDSVNNIIINNAGESARESNYCGHFEPENFVAVDNVRPKYEIRNNYEDVFTSTGESFCEVTHGEFEPSSEDELEQIYTNSIMAIKTQDSSNDDMTIVNEKLNTVICENASNSANEDADSLFAVSIVTGNPFKLEAINIDCASTASSVSCRDSCVINSPLISNIEDDEGDNVDQDGENKNVYTNSSSYEGMDYLSECHQNEASESSDADVLPNAKSVDLIPSCKNDSKPVVQKSQTNANETISLPRSSSINETLGRSKAESSDQRRKFAQSTTANSSNEPPKYFAVGVSRTKHTDKTVAVTGNGRSRIVKRDAAKSVTRISPADRVAKTIPQRRQTISKKANHSSDKVDNEETVKRICKRGATKEVSATSRSKVAVNTPETTVVHSVHECNEGSKVRVLNISKKTLTNSTVSHNNEDVVYRKDKNNVMTPDQNNVSRLKRRRSFTASSLPETCRRPQFRWKAEQKPDNKHALVSPVKEKGLVSHIPRLKCQQIEKPVTLSDTSSFKELKGEELKTNLQFTFLGNCPLKNWNPFDVSSGSRSTSATNRSRRASYSGSETRTSARKRVLSSSDK